MPSFLLTLYKIVRLGLLGVVAVSATATGYITTLALLALPRRTERVSGPIPPYDFTIIVPAHNEELLIGKTLTSLQALDYPRQLFQICVVADNCTDRTAAIAREMGVRVFERTDTTKRGKGHALEWLLDQLLGESDKQADKAYVFFDADSTVSPNFLKTVALQLARGAEVIQCYYGGANPEDSWRSALRYVALAAINYARPMGRERLGLSVGLKGNGMVFAGPLLKQIGWQVYTRAEDVEMHARLLLLGKRVAFAPNCQVFGVMPSTGKQARSQEMRWEGGRLEMAGDYIPRFLGAMSGRSWRQQAILLDGAVEVAIPPISMLAGLGALGLVVSVLFRDRQLRNLSIFNWTGLIVYVGSSLVAARAPLKVYTALPFAPVFIVWKIALYVYAAVRGKRNKEWIRTARTTK